MMKKNIDIIVSSAICFAAVVGMVIALCLTGGAGEKMPFSAPEFDKSAVVGTPTDTGESYMQIYKEGMGFSAHICGRVALKDGAADVYFTNDAENEVWMKLRIIDESGKILAETGLLKPGEYVKSVAFDTAPAVGTKIKMKIMAYEPETYYSAGAVSLNTVIAE